MTWMAVFTPLIVYFSIQFFFVAVAALMRFYNIIQVSECVKTCTNWSFAVVVCA
jgi:hypothetical protein